MNTQKSTLPLATIIIFSYNQENFIREATEGALLQTYPNLQIVFSDDCSSDDTFTIIETLVHRYGGPHKITLNRNQKNLGTGDHCDAAFALAEGEYIILAAGDDISQPDRVEKTVQAFMNSKNPTSGVFSNLQKINRHSEVTGLMFHTTPRMALSLEDFKKGIPCWAVGASLSIKRNLITNYRKFGSGVLQEDGVLAFRAILENGITYIDEPLVKYRFHENNLSQTQNPGRQIRLQKNEFFFKMLRLEDALLLHNKDRSLINILKRQSAQAKFKRIILTIPLVGFIYFSLRNSAKNLFKFLKR